VAAGLTLFYGQRVFLLEGHFINFVFLLPGIPTFSLPQTTSALLLSSVSTEEPELPQEQMANYLTLPYTSIES
jgi:hypothetical protein